MAVHTWFLPFGPFKETAIAHQSGMRVADFENKDRERCLRVPRKREGAGIRALHGEVRCFPLGN